MVNTLEPDLGRAKWPASPRANDPTGSRFGAFNSQPRRLGTIPTICLGRPKWVWHTHKYQNKTYDFLLYLSAAVPLICAIVLFAIRVWTPNSTPGSVQHFVGPTSTRMGGLQNLFVKLSFGILVIGTIMKFNRRRYYCKSKHMVTLMTTKVAHITVFPMNESGRV